MICKCQNLSKKVTILNGIKKLTGDLIYYEINDDKYINICCFILLISSLYSIYDINWFKNCKTIIVADELKQLFKLEPYMLDDLTTWIPSKCSLTKADELFRIAPPEIERILNENIQMYRTLIELDKKYNSMIYKYNATLHDNYILTEENSTLKLNKVSVCDNNETSNICSNCKSFDIIKDELKLIKKESYEKINKYYYDLNISNKKIIELTLTNKNLFEEINKLRDTNHALANNYLSE